MGNEVCFKFDCLRSFFLATRLGNTADLFRQATSSMEFHELLPEIDLFTGLHRDRKDFLESFLRILDDLHGAVALDLPLDVFDQIGAEGSPLSIEKRDMIVRDLSATRLSFEEQEKLLDELDDSATAMAHKRPRLIARPAPRPYIQFIMALQACSIVLRNSELVDDVNLKANAYDKLLALWSELLIGLVLAVDLSPQDTEGTALAPVVKDLAPETAKHLTKILVSFVVFALIRENLGTPTLEKLTNDHLDTADHNIERMIDTFLCADLDLPKYMDRLEALAKSIDSQFQLEIVFTKSLAMMLMKYLPEDHAKRLIALMGKALTKMSSAGSKRLDDMQRQHFLEKVRKLGLLEKAGTAK